LQEEHKRLRNLVQISKPMPIISENADSAMEQLFEAFVVDKERGTKTDRRVATRLLKQAFHTRVPDELVHEKVQASVGRQREPVDFAVGNGRLVELAHGWSFMAREPQQVLANVKAWSWTIDQVRSKGGRVVLGNGEEYSVPDGVPIAVVYVPPNTEEGQIALDEALDVFDRLQIEAASTEDVSRVVEDTVARLARIH
jgi:hypothetical protein